MRGLEFMSNSPALGDAIASLESMLAADGYELEVRELSGDAACFKIWAGPEACAECLVPKSMMVAYFKSALGPCLGPELPEIQLSYPGDED